MCKKELGKKIFHHKEHKEEGTHHEGAKVTKFKSINIRTLRVLRKQPIQ
jgi:hypothetical protein